MNVANKEFYIDYEVEVPGTDGSQVSDSLYLSFDKEGNLADAVLMYIHSYKEIEWESSYNIDTDDAIEILKNPKVL